MNKENSIPLKRASIDQLQFLTGLAFKTLLKSGMRRHKNVVLAEKILIPHLEAAMLEAKKEYDAAVSSPVGFNHVSQT